MLIFGAGTVFAVPLQDASGNAISNPTPIKIAAMQSMSLDFSGDLKELYGQYQMPIDTARGKVKTSGKITNAHIYGAAVNTLFFGQTVTSGTQNAAYEDLTGAAIPATPYQITPTAPSSGTWQEDLGVIDANGRPMTRVASGVTTGQYSVSAGVYTFAAADTGLTVFINYRYSFTNAAGKSITINNLQMGAAPKLKLLLATTYSGKRSLVRLNSVVSNKLALLSTKLDDYNIPDLEYGAFADASGVLGIIDMSE